MLLHVITIIIITFKGIHCYTNVTYYNHSLSSFEYDYFNTMFNQVKDNYLSKLPMNPSHEQCVNKIESQLLSLNTIYDIIQYSGKGYSDAGLYSQCKAANYSYFLYVYKRLIRPSDYVMTFLRQKNSFYGLCIYQECFDFFNQSIVEQTLAPVFDVDTDSSIRKYSIKNSTVNTIISTEATDQDHIYVIIISSILVLFLIMKISIWLFRLACEKDRRVLQGNEIELVNDDTLDDPSMESEAVLLHNEPKNLFMQNQSKEQRALMHSREMQAKVLKGLLSALDIHENFSLLHTNQSYCYDNSNLDLLSFTRAMIVYLLTYNHNFYSLVQIPIKNLISLSFFNNFRMQIFKMSTFAINAWIVVEGFILAYKFMSYCKKTMIKQDLPYLPFKYLIFFYLKALSKVIAFIIIVIIFSLGVNQFSFFNVPPMFSFFTDVLNKRECRTKPSLFFNPFGLLYFDYIEQYFGFSNCYKYVNVCYNMHICFIFTVLLIYLSMKLKSKVFDLIILFLFIINLSLIKLTCGFDYTTVRTSTFSVNYLYGETFSLKYPHLFINYYFIGVIGGMVYFYYIDIITATTFQVLNSNHNPLFFCFHLMKGIDSMANWLRTLLFILCLGIMLAISLAFFFFYEDKWDKDANPFLFPITGLYQFIDMYEKMLFVIPMIFAILLCLFSRNDSSFHSFYSSMLFRFIDRISFPLFCSMDNFIYIFYSTYHIIVLLNFNNTLFFALGLVILLIMSSSIIVFTVELPIKMVTCWVTSQERDNDPNECTAAD